VTISPSAWLDRPERLLLAGLVAGLAAVGCGLCWLLVQLAELAKGLP
jgi:hypothetical protein